MLRYARTAVRSWSETAPATAASTAVAPPDAPESTRSPHADGKRAQSYKSSAWGLSLAHLLLSKRDRLATMRAFIAASAGLQGLTWLIFWRSLGRHSNRERPQVPRAISESQGISSGAGAKLTFATATPLLLAFGGYVGWFFGSVGYALSPSSSLFRPISPALSSPLVGIGLILCGHGLIVWAACALGSSFGLLPDVRAGHRLVQHGPYRFVRHPLYTGLHALYLGTFALVPSGFFLLCLVAGVIGNVLRARAEEHALIAHYGSAYRMYAQSVGRFLPAPRHFLRRAKRPRAKRMNGHPT